MKRLPRTVQLATALVCMQGALCFSQAYVQAQTSGLDLNTAINSFGASANRTTSSSTVGLPGAFGGPGITGVARKEYSNTNIFEAFSTGGSTAGSTGSSGSLGGNSAAGSSSMGGFGGTSMGGLGGMSMGGLGGGRMGMMGMGGLGGLGGFGANRNRGALGGANSTPQMRAVIRPDYENLATERQSSLAEVPAVLSRLPLPERLKGINANVEENTIVLTGSVATESDKRLAEKIVRLEPGVHSVRNELQIVPGTKSLRSNSTAR